jgi:hypothetical protein
MRAYQGYSIRGEINSGRVTQWKRLKFNFNAPIVDLSAGWFASRDLDWEVANNPDATQEAYAIWKKSGSNLSLLEAARCCGIQGDIVLLITQDKERRPVFEFVDAAICFPVFEGNNYQSLQSLEICYEYPAEDGKPIIHREFYGKTQLEVYENNILIETTTYDRIPACWIRNKSIKGLPFGISDIEPVFELVEEYDHLASKQTRIVDYYASPNITATGVTKGSFAKDVNSIYYLPAGAEMKFLEWSGNVPMVGEQLTNIRGSIEEISQVPAVAFGRSGGASTNISGVALQILYGPLISKTQDKQASWMPCLQYAMWIALQASGFTMELEEVSCIFPSPVPQDGLTKTQEVTQKVGAGILSKRSAMNALGVENPNEELKRILVEEKISQMNPMAQATLPTPMDGGQASTQTTPIDSAGWLAEIDKLFAEEQQNLSAKN